MKVQGLTFKEYMEYNAAEEQHYSHMFFTSKLLTVGPGFSGFSQLFMSTGFFSHLHFPTKFCCV